MDREALGEQQEIGWDQILKDHISRRWGKVQGIIYMNNIDTRGCKHFIVEVQMTKINKSVLDLTLGMWKDRCGILHGADEGERKNIWRPKIMAQVKKSYQWKYQLGIEFFIIVSRRGWYIM